MDYIVKEDYSDFQDWYNVSTSIIQLTYLMLIVIRPHDHIANCPASLGNERQNPREEDISRRVEYFVSSMKD